MELKLYAISELAGMLNLHPKTILRFIHEGKIRARKIGRSWMVSEADLRDYCHAELAGEARQQASPDFETLGERIRVSAVVEIVEQNSEEASRLSNSLMAMLNGERGPDGQARFDSFYYPETGKAKYVFYGGPALVENVLHVFTELCRQKGD